ncbi:MAG: alanine dehydrogenase [Salinivirgaceae bacterium]
MNEEKSFSNKVSFEKNVLMPQEEMLEQKKSNNKLSIAVPKECSANENRVSLAPHAVEMLVNHGHTVLIERNAGLSANFPDHEYSEMGGKIISDRGEIFQADIIIKVAPLTKEEISQLKGKQVVISSLQMSTQDADYFKLLQRKKITALAYEFIKDEESKVFPVTESMSEISGSAAILIAAEYLSNVNNGKGEMLGGISGVSPTDLVVLGATTAGEYAVRTALGLGASVKVFDKSIGRLRQLQRDIGQHVFTSIIQPRVVKKALKTADVVIGALPMADEAPFLVSEEAVMNMKPNSIIIDIGIDHGGCFETSTVCSHERPIFKKYNVIHYCVPNIPSRVARTASYALSNIFGALLIQIGEYGNLRHLIRYNKGMRNGVYMYNGILTKERIGRKYDISSRDIDLLLAAF